MIDTHAHLDFEQFDKDQRETVKRFFEKGGKAILNVGVDFERNQKTFGIVDKYEKVFAIIGFHPEAGKIDLKKVDEYLRENCSHPKVKAIGEIGLDYFHTPNQKVQGKATNEDKIEFQKKLFIKQLEIAKKLKLPVVVHCRDAYDDLLKIISRKSFKDLKIVIHCFSGNLEQTKKFLELKNVKFSFTGNVTFVKPESEFLQVVKKIPLSKIMVETDCPFLAPDPHRGKRNEPSYVRFIIDKIAEVKELQFVEVEMKTDRNAERFFELS